MVAALTLAGASVNAARSEATLGALESKRIASDPIFPVETPSTWATHLPKLVSTGDWSYAVFTRYTSDVGTRMASIYKRRLKPTPGEWTDTGRAFKYIHQHPGLAIDTRGRLHVAFDCLPHLSPAVTSCTSGGADAGASTRFYDLVFSTRLPDGSINLDESSLYESYAEYSDQALGYMSIATDPANGETFASLALPANSRQGLFELGVPNSSVSRAPKRFPPSHQVYPQIAISPQGVRYYSVAEYLQTSRRRASKGLALFKLSGSGFRRPSFTDSISRPFWPRRYVFPSSMAFGPDGKLYLLYGRKTRHGRCNSYLVKEARAGRGKFRKPIAVGCHDYSADLQVDSAGRIYIVEDDNRMDGSENDKVGVPGPNLTISESADGGDTWTRHNYEIPINDFGFPAGSTDTYQPTLDKPWASPQGYSPDVLRGVVANSVSSTACPTTRDPCSWSMHEFSIPVN